MDALSGSTSSTLPRDNSLAGPPSIQLAAKMQDEISRTEVIINSLKKKLF